jgi:hypothetical protein
MHRIPLKASLTVFVGFFGFMAAVAAGTAQDQIASGALLARVDHLVYATSDLQTGVDRIEELLGVLAAPGGQHLGRGTRNALLSLVMSPRGRVELR